MEIKFKIHNDVKSIFIRLIKKKHNFDRIIIVNFFLLVIEILKMTLDP